MKWKVPPAIKVYEALGVIADKRIKVKGDDAEVFSSSGNKIYAVQYDCNTSAIVANDNGSYWQGYLGYPSIAFLMVKGILKYDKNLAEYFGGIKWKDVNTKFKDDYEKSETYLKSKLGEERWVKAQELTRKVLAQIEKLSLHRLASKAKPPEGY